ncbi:hypothetical protein PDJAM_G00258940 [Pangasius djambal]|nr:hypothetical protein [Pangasius djambal]
MAAEDLCTTLAHTRSPKTSRRTTFQDELEAAVNERAARNRLSHFNSYDFNDEDEEEDDDDVLKELLKTRRKKIEMFKFSRTKTSINDFKLSDDEAENIRPKKNSQSESPVVRKSQSESSACRRTLSESPLPLYSENSQWESSSEGVLEAIPPKPAPRQRAPHSAITGHDEEDGRTQTPCSRAATSPVSSTNTSTSTSSQIAGNSGSDARQDCVSVKANTDSRPLEGAESTGSSRKSRSTPSYSTESRYLGTLKVLEQKSCLQEMAPDTADSLRAAVYQDWLKKKEEKLQVTFRVKKQEEKLKEEKKTEEEMSKKAEAKASYEAWKEKKREALREKIREKQEAMRKLQKEMNDKEERKETAKRVFEKWKREHDDLLREQLQKEVQTANRLKEKKETEKEQRKRESSSSFAQWSDRKKEVIEEKLKSERRKKEIKEIEEKYEKEEREKTALDMYEEWLRRKEFQQKQERREKKMKATVAEEPPPPWSPPNRTVPFGK